MTKSESAIGDLLTALLDNIDKPHKALVQSLKDESSVSGAIAAVQSGNVEDFYYLLRYPLSQFVECLISEVSNKPELRFLFAHSDFVDNHLDNLFESMEGHACSADKTRTVMRALALHFLSERPIQFDYHQQYTYQLPKKVLKDQAQILRFFKGIYNLYYGQPKEYLAVYGELLKVNESAG